MKRKRGWPPPKVTIKQWRLDALEARFDVPDYGWIGFHLPVLLGERHIACSEVIDPFPAMIAWLEAIADRNAVCGWQICEEGSSRHLVYLAATGPCGDDAAQLIVSGTADAIHGIAACVVSRRALVSGIYSAFRAMTQHPDYDPYHWEGPPPTIQLDALTDEEDEAVRAKYPFSGEFLRDLRSAKVEAFLASPPEPREDEARQPWESLRGNDAQGEFSFHR